MDHVSDRADHAQGGRGSSPNTRASWRSAWRDPSAALSAGGPLLATAVLPFALVLYLALANGGYDAVVRTEIGIAIWWLLLIGALIGLVPSGWVGARGWAAIALLFGLVGWTALGIPGTESVERTFDETARILIYLGVFTLALSVQGPAGLRRAVGAIGAAIGVVAAIALLSRFQPSWFPANEPAEFLPGTRERLTHPLNYWNGLAALVAVGVPLLLVLAAESSRRVGQALATAGLPILALTAFYTFSRAAIPAIVVGLLAVLALGWPRRNLLAVLGVGIAGGAVAIFIATRFDSLEAGNTDSAAATGGDVMLGVTVVICALVAVARLVAIPALHVDRLPHPSRSAKRRAAVAVALGAVVAAIALDLPGEVSDRWEEFKDPAPAGVGADRFGTLSGAGRYQQWGAALDAFESEPLTGIGAGTYEFWWAREAPITDFVRDAHSLYLETLAELGIVGLILLLAFLAVLLLTAIQRSLGASGAERAYFGAAAGAIAAFAVAAALDWTWELTVIPVAVLWLGGAVCARDPRENRTAGVRAVIAPWIPHVAIAALAIPAFLLLGHSLLTLNALEDSRADFRRGEFDAALDSARTAADRQPWSATASLQAALVLERLGELDAAGEAAAEATYDEPTNWRTWLILSRIEAQQGDVDDAVAAYELAVSLNPRGVSEEPEAAP